MKSESLWQTMTQQRLVSSIEKLPLEGDIQKLQDTDGYRLRVGSFRVSFDENSIIKASQILYSRKSFF